MSLNDWLEIVVSRLSLEDVQAETGRETVNRIQGWSPSDEPKVRVSGG